MKNQTVAVVDFGGQYKELIARRVRECHVYSLVFSHETPIEEIQKHHPIGIILTGGPNSVYAPNAPQCPRQLLELGVPVLGICYGMQALSYALGGQVSSCSVSEYGPCQVNIAAASPLWQGITDRFTALMSHTDYVSAIPSGFHITAATANCPVAAMENPQRRLYGVQFHPEVQLTEPGKQLIHNFLYHICGAAGDYSLDDVADQLCRQLQREAGSGRVVLGLSGGVDSSVCAALLSRALPGQAACIFVDHGMMRQDEPEQIAAYFSQQSLQFISVDASQRFLNKLQGIDDPEQKRKIIGKEFVHVFEEQAKRLGDCQFLAQGTIYPDIIESGTQNAATIKSHHNVGGLPKTMGFTGVLEPLRHLFKDEVRALGKVLGLPDELTERQPFPGPGLAVRIIGDITAEKLQLLKKADAIFRRAVDALPQEQRPDQYFAVLTNLRSVGVMGDDRTYDYTLALRAVTTDDFMTCRYTHLDHQLLEKVSTEITNQVKGINRVVFDITGKPPATIEWE